MRGTIGSSTAVVVLAMAGALVASGCSSGTKVAGTPGQEQTKAMERLKSLAGEWTELGPDGKPQTIVYSVTAGGSAVREVMFPGMPHEMTNLYHMDGASLVCTHYCALGNQPRMRARGLSADGKSIVFTFDSVTNLAKPDGQYMGGLALEMPDADHVTQVWTSYANGKPVEEHVRIALTRKK